MSVVLYKPNSKNSGAAFTFSTGTNPKNGEPTFFISSIAQHSWNDERKIGSFSGNSGDPEKTVNVKLSEFECGDFLSAFRGRYDYSTFHSFDGKNTTIKLSPWDKPTKISKYDSESKGFKDTQIKVPAFGISITKGKGNTFKIALDPGEVEVLCAFIRRVLDDLFTIRIQKQKENFKKRQFEDGATTRPAFKKAEVSPSVSPKESPQESDEDDPPF